MRTLTKTCNDLDLEIAQAIDFLYAAQLPSGTFQIFCLPHLFQKRTANRIDLFVRPLKSLTAWHSQKLRN